MKVNIQITTIGAWIGFNFSNIILYLGHILSGHNITIRLLLSTIIGLIILKLSKKI